jgi:glycosyltransferase involved in cell wall biosynthesis
VGNPVNPKEAAALPRVQIVAKRLDIGGTERHLTRILPLLQKRGLEISVFLLERGGKLDQTLENAGVAIAGPRRVLPRYPHLLIAAWQLNRHLRRYRPDVLHYFLSEPYLLGSFAAIGAGKTRRIMSRRSLNHYQRRHPVLAPVERWLHRWTSVLLGNSTAVVEDLMRECNDRSKIGLIQNGIEIPERITPERRRAARQDLAIPDDAFVLCVSANLIPYKGHHDLFSALGLIRARLPEPWRILIIGRDEGIAAGLRAKAAFLNFADNVIWLNERADAQSPLDAADVSVLPSHEEGFSNSLLEAMARGLPVIATAVGGNMDAIVPGVSGILVPVKDPQALASGILQLSADPALRQKLADGAAQRVASCFSIDGCVRRYLNLYRGWRNFGTAAIQDMIDPPQAEGSR